MSSLSQRGENRVPGPDPRCTEPPDAKFNAEGEALRGIRTLTQKSLTVALKKRKRVAEEDADSNRYAKPSFGHNTPSSGKNTGRDTCHAVASHDATKTTPCNPQAKIANLWVSAPTGDLELWVQANIRKASDYDGIVKLPGFDAGASDDEIQAAFDSIAGLKGQSFSTHPLSGSKHMCDTLRGICRHVHRHPVQSSR